MNFEAWIGQLVPVLDANHPGITPTMLDANAMYQAFANGVSPDVFGGIPTLPLKPTPQPLVQSSPVVIPPVQNLPVSPLATAEIKPNWSATTNQNSSSQPKASLNSTHMGLAVLGFMLVAGVVFNLYLRLSDPGFPPAQGLPQEAPLNDTQRLEKARQSISTWAGDESTYVASKSLLSSISKESPSYKEAQSLTVKWDARKKESEKHKAEKAKADEELQRQHERQEALDAIKNEKKDMAYFTGEGDVKVAVPTVNLKRSTESHEASGKSTFVHVFIGVKNVGTETIHANPNDFTLADSDGNTASPDTDTYGLSNYFNAVNLSPGQQTSGWLIFYLKKDERYTLTRSGMVSGSNVTKTIIP